VNLPAWLAIRGAGPMRSVLYGRLLRSDRPQDIEDKEAMRFLAGEKGDADLSQGGTLSEVFSCETGRSPFSHFAGPQFRAKYASATGRSPPSALDAIMCSARRA